MAEIQAKSIFAPRYPGRNPDLWQGYPNALGEYFTINSYEHGAERLIKIANADDESSVFWSTVQYLLSGGDTSYDLTATTIDAKEVAAQTMNAHINDDCKGGGGGYSVSRTGEIHLQCPYLEGNLFSGQGDCTGTVYMCIRSYHYRMPNPNRAPNVPNSPTPAANTSDVPITSAFTWSGGDPDVGDPVTYDVYLVPPGAPSILICEGISVTTCDPPDNLATSTNYGWRVEANDGLLSTSSEFWFFRTVSGNIAPNPPTNPSPADGATNVPVRHHPHLGRQRPRRR